MKNVIKGKVAIKLGDVINSDQMFPPSYMWQHDWEIKPKFCLTNYDPEFPERVRPGDIIIAGKIFGHGHSHMDGLTGFQKLGVSAVTAESFSPGWYRGAIASGFPVIACPGITKKVNVGDELEVNFKTSNIKNLTTGEILKAESIHPIIREILDAGGIAAYAEKKVGTAPSRYKK
ncbi:3-isopropylmalate dehydratase [Chloroflexota bacterium]